MSTEKLHSHDIDLFEEEITLGEMIYVAAWMVICSSLAASAMWIMVGVIGKAV